MDAAVVQTPQRSLITTALVVVSVLFPLLSLATLGLRYHAKRVSRQAFFADDYWCLAAWMLTLPVSINIWVFSSKVGIDHYKTDMLSGINNSLKCLFISSILVQVPLTLIKISILLFYKRIFVFRPFQIVAWLSIALVSCWGVIFFFLVLFEVDPVSGAWTGQGRYRYDINALGYAQVGSSIALDIAVLCLPIPIVCKLHMPAKRKAAVVFIFWLGAFCCIAAVLRLVFLHDALGKVIESISNIYLQWRNIIFMVLEPNCSIVAACLPTYSPLLGKRRKPESLIKSFRSVFSIRSNVSSRNASQARADSKERASDDDRSSDQTEIQVHTKRSGSQDWVGTGSHHGHTVTSIASVDRLSEPRISDLEMGGLPPNRTISVIRAIGVTRD